jgi:hypothetical protein
MDLFTPITTDIKHLARMALSSRLQSNPLAESCKNQKIMIVQPGSICQICAMKNPNTKAPKAVRAWLAEIGSTGGKGSDSSAKRRAAMVRWAKPGARKVVVP